MGKCLKNNGGKRKYFREGNGIFDLGNGGDFGNGGDDVWWGLEEGLCISADDEIVSVGYGFL